MCSVKYVRKLDDIVFAVRTPAAWHEMAAHIELTKEIGRCITAATQDTWEMSSVLLHRLCIALLISGNAVLFRSTVITN